MQNVRRNVKIHDFRFDTLFDVENGTAKIISTTVYFIGIEEYGFRLSSDGQTYVLSSYVDELQEKLNKFIKDTL
jgi:hypothetical protein